MARLPDVFAPRPTPRPSRAIAGISQGAAGAVGTALQGFGATVANVGGQIADREATAAAKEADVVVADKIRALLYDPETGFTNMQGSSAVSAREGVSGQLAAIEAAALEGLSPGARRKLTDIFASRRERALMTIDTHTAGERRTWASGARDARIEASYQDVLADPGAMEVSLGLISSEIRGRALDEGWSSERTELELTKARSTVYRSVTEAIDDPERAALYLNANKGNMTGSDVLALEAKIVPLAKEAEGRRIGLAWAMGGDYVPPADNLSADVMAALGKDNPVTSGINGAAKALGISPLDLATAISYETGGTFNPEISGPTTQWGTHKGLIQFGEPQAQQYGVDWSDPVGSQLGADGAIVKYLRAAGVQPGMGLMDIYSAINAGAVGKYDASDANNGGAPGTVADKVAGMDVHRAKAAALLGWERSADRSGLDEILKISDPIVRAAALREYDLQGRAIQTENAVEQKAYLSGLDEDLAYAAANGAPPSTSAYDPARVDALYRPLPGLSADENAARAAQGEEVKRRYETGLVDAEVMSRVNVAPPAEIAASLADAEAAVKEPLHSEEDVARLASLQKAVTARNAAIVEDGAGFAAKTNANIGAYLTAYDSVAPEQKQATAQGYQAALASSYDRLGVPEDLRRVLPKTMAVAEAAALNRAPADQAALVAQQFMADWGNPRVTAELMEAGLAPEIGVAMRRTDNPGLMAEITNLRGVTKEQLSQALAAGEPKLAEDAMQGALGDYQAAFIAGGGPAAVATFEQNYSVANKLALKYVAQGMDPAAAGERAAQEVFSETPINESHIKLIAPVGVTESDVSFGLERAMSEEALRAFAPAPLDNPNFPEFVDAEIMIEAAQEGVWLNNSTADGAVLHLNLGGYYLPVLGADGQPYEVRFADMAKAGLAGGKAGLRSSQ